MFHILADISGHYYDIVPCGHHLISDARCPTSLRPAYVS